MEGYTLDELDCVIRELDAVKNREKDPGSRICLSIAIGIVQKEMKKELSKKVKETIKGVKGNG